MPDQTTEMLFICMLQDFTPVQAQYFYSIVCVCLLSVTQCVLTVVLQGEEGPPSLEYIQAKDLFPQKELVKEDDSLQVSCSPSCHMMHQNENSWPEPPKSLNVPLIASKGTI